MCGIAGFWQSRPGRISTRETLLKMGAALEHRGPDDCGMFFEDSAGLGLVHRRLSILDLSSAGLQPMTSSSGRYTIAFNGEIYNFEEIKSELNSRHKWRGHSDTEVMLEAFERWGLVNAVKRFVGMFAFVLWDGVEQKLHLVRDRLGIKPLYYGVVDGALVFASELKAIRQYPGFQAAIDRDALALYMRHNYVPSPHCIYRGQFKLRPGYIATITKPTGDPHQAAFWSAFEIAESGLRSPSNYDDREAVERLEQELKRAVGLRMIADVPLGAFLSGGIDSSAIVAVMQAQSVQPIKTFTIGFDESEYNEAAHAKRVAAHLGTDHTELYVRPSDALNVVPSLPLIFDEPFADSSQIPTFLVSQLARRQVTVSLSGDGGDELFGGYNRYFLITNLWNRTKVLPPAARSMIANLIARVPPSGIDKLGRLFRPFLPQALRWSAIGDKAHKLVPFFSLEDPQSMYLQALSHWSEPSRVVLGANEPDTVKTFISKSSGLGSIEEGMMLTDLANYLPDDILTKVDRTSMAVSLEARVPMLDHRLVEFAWTLPLGVKIRAGKGKWILRQLLNKYVPAHLIERPKMGFGVPIHSWLRGPLREWAEDLLSKEALDHYRMFDTRSVRNCWSEHISGRRNWQHLLWCVLIFQQWISHGVEPAQVGPVECLMSAGLSGLARK